MNAKAVIAIVAVMATPALTGSNTASAAELVFSCTNSVSHAVWSIKVDNALRTADGFPAEISSARIAWRDPGHGTYDLDRSSGVLTYSNASSTGGYMLFHLCHPMK